MFRQALILLTVLFMPACAGEHPREASVPQEAGGRPEDEVTVGRDLEFQETTFSIAAGDCRISLTVYQSEANRGIIRCRSDCGLTLGEQAPLIGKVLRKVMESGTDAAGFRRLSWGRLHPDGARDATMSVRLALAAKRSATRPAVFLGSHPALISDCVLGIVPAAAAPMRAQSSSCCS